MSRRMPRQQKDKQTARAEGTEKLERRQVPKPGQREEPLYPEADTKA